MSGNITQRQMVMEKGEQMRALRLDHFGPPTVLHVQNIARPRAGSGEVLVEVYGTSVNPSDVKNVQGMMKQMQVISAGRRRQIDASSVVADRTEPRPALDTAGRSQFAAHGVASGALPTRERRRLLQSGTRPLHPDRAPTPSLQSAAATFASGSSLEGKAAHAPARWCR